MPIKFHCPACQSPVRAPDDLAGQTLACPKCGEPITVPSTGEPGTSPTTPPPPPPPSAKTQPVADELDTLSNFEAPVADDSAPPSFALPEHSAPETPAVRTASPASASNSRIQFTLPQFELPLAAKIKHLVGWAVAAALASFVLGVATLVLWILLAIATASVGGLMG